MLELFRRRREVKSLDPSVKSLDPSVDSVGPPALGWANDTAIPDQMRQAWIQHGLVVLHGLFDSRQVDEYNTIVAKVRSAIDDGKDEFGYGDRIGQLHQKYNHLLELANSERITQFLAWAFGDKPIVFGSLNFERGSTQAAHIDAIVFCPQPTYSMAGLWVAREDIHPDSGPLFYIPGSHQWPLAHGEDVVATHPDLATLRIKARGLNDSGERSAIVRKLSDAWTGDFARLLEERNAGKVTLELKKGDAVVWHSHLAHGGQPRNNPKLGRRSAVFHFHWQPHEALYF